MDQHHLSETASAARLGALALCLISTLCAVANAQEARGRRDRHEIYFDERHHHAHYYPAVGYSVPVLPADSIAVPFRGGRLFFNAGVWYRLAGPAFVVIRPPEGIVIPALPAGYATVWAGDRPYYYANDTYYIQSSDGYSVVAAPATPLTEKPPTPAPAATAVPVPMAPPGPAVPPSPAAAQAPAQTSSVWYYCSSTKAYYPYVGECREGWQAVPTKPY